MTQPENKPETPDEEASTECDHEWEFQDDSFDHEYGCQQVFYFLCEKCGQTREVEPGDYDDEDWGPNDYVSEP